MTRIVIDLASDDEQATVRLLKRLLKILGRAYGIKCKGITSTSSDP